MESKNMIGWKK